MKIFIVFLVIFLSFSDGRDPIQNDPITNASSTITSTTTSTTTSATTSTTTSATTTTTSVSTTTVSTSTITTIPPGADVSINVTWTFASETKVTSVVMIVKNLQSAQWAAIGLGQQQQMDEAHVFMCKRLSNDTVVLNRYINPGGDPNTPPVPAGSEQGGILTLGQQTFTDGVVTCRFSLSNFTTQGSSQLKVLRPLSPSGSYHPLFAIGPLDDNGEPYQHFDGSYTALSNLVQLNQDETILYRLSVSTTTIYPGTTTTIYPSTTTASPTADVSVNVTWAFANETKVTSVVMIVKNLQSAQWAAIGLGQEQKMGEAHVFMCKRLSNDTIVLNRYINPKDHDYPKPADSGNGGVLTITQQTYTNGVVTCQFTLSNFTTEKSPQLNDLNPLSQSRSYHPLFAIGLLDVHGGPRQHSDDSRTALSDLAQLNQNKTILYRASNPANDGTMKYYQAHGIIMVFAWIFFASTGILITRYFKNSWANKIICGEAAWFAAHRFILSIATILTILGFLFILVANQGTWVGSNDEKKHFIHSITGAIVISFAFFQPFIALFRCKPTSPYRFIYNYLHGFVGFSALILSIVTLFLATYFELFKDDRARIVMIVWSFWLVLIFITFEIIQVYFRKNRDGSHYSNIDPLNKTIDDILDSTPSPSVTLSLDNNEHQPTFGDKLKNVLLALHVLFAAIVSIIFSILIG